MLDNTVPIAAVERDTGLSKDALRVWEKRYGFPRPLRDAKGERVYSGADVERLRLVKRLLDRGFRPGKVLAADEAAFQAMLASCSAESSEQPAQIDEGMTLLQAHRSEELRRLLQQWLLKLGLQRFVVELVAPMNREVGEAWMRGELDVSQEHLYTEQIQNVLRGAISAHGGGTRPRVLLTTFPDEQHSLGLLMAEAMLVPEGASCVSLGAQTPLPDIASAVRGGDYDIVALSFSAAFPQRQAHAGLRELAPMLPERVELWVGGQVLAARPLRIPGMRFFARIEDTVDALKQWRNKTST